MPLPPHQHPLDWYVIPELKGETSSFLAYTKTGWVCRLCSSDKLSNVEDHCRSIEHIENHRRLEIRREELKELVDREEELILEARHSELLQEQQRQQKAKAALEASRERQRQEEQDMIATKERLIATERRSNLQANRDMRLAQAHRNSLRKAHVEEFSSSGRSSQRVRRLRAQRLAAQNQTRDEEEIDPQVFLKRQKEKEKEEKRQKMIEITKKHQEKQRLEEIRAEEERLVRKKAEEDRLRDLTFDCFGCGIWDSHVEVCSGAESWLEKQFSAQ